MMALIAETAVNEISPLAASGATAILAGVVVWLAKTYRDDMKERAIASQVSHEKVAAEFKKTSEETRDKFLTTIEKHKDALDDLCDSVRSLHCNARHPEPPRSDPKLHARPH